MYLGRRRRPLPKRETFSNSNDMSLIALSSAYCQLSLPVCIVRLSPSSTAHIQYASFAICREKVLGFNVSLGMPLLSPMARAHACTVVCDALSSLPPLCRGVNLG
jgi:hypothetical protein